MIDTADPAAQQAPGASEALEDARLEAPVRLAGRPTASTRRPPAAALALALVAHTALLFALLREPADPLAGGQGQQLDSISVTLTSSNVLESLKIDQPPSL